MPRKKETNEVVFDEASLNAEKVVPVTKNKVLENLEIIEKELNRQLEDIEGIGPVRLKKLYALGVYNIEGLLSQGEEWISRHLEISFSEARTIIERANSIHSNDNIFSTMYVSGKEYMDYRLRNIQYLTSGLKELDEILEKRGRGYESGVITEFYGAYGAGKTQVMMVACVMAQLPKNACCLTCGQTEHLDSDKCKTCGGTIWLGGGLSEFDKPCRVMYFDTENSYRPERLYEIICNREIIKTKPQTATQIKMQANKEPLNDQEFEKAMRFVDNVNVSRPRTSGLLISYVNNLESIINGDFCKICHKRQININLEPTHQNHPNLKKDIPVETHDFVRDEQVKLVIVDSLTGKFRKEFEGRGELSDRQTKMTSYIKVLENTAEIKNVVVLVTNQVQELLGVTMGDNIRPVGGHQIGHTLTHRIYLKKPQSVTKSKIDATLVDSPNMPKQTISMELGFKGIQPLSQ